jgi:hypothetical protein
MYVCMYVFVYVSMLVFQYVCVSAVGIHITTYELLRFVILMPIAIMKFYLSAVCLMYTELNDHKIILRSSVITHPLFGIRITFFKVVKVLKVLK